MTIEKLRILLKEKEKLLGSEDERVSNLKILLEQDDIFFKLENNTAIGILEFLGIPEDKIYDCYLSLLSADEFQKVGLHIK